MSYPASIIPDRWRIAGLRLRSLTLGHVALGERMGVPYFDGTDSGVDSPEPNCSTRGPIGPSTPGPGDLALALFICSRPWAEAARALQGNRGRWRRTFTAWLLGEAESFIHHQNQFLRYLEAQFQSPDTWTKGEGKGCAAPAMLSLRARLITDFRVGWAESLDIPIAEALWLSAAQAEREGGIDWVTESERKAMELAKSAAQGAAHGQKDNNSNLNEAQGEKVSDGPTAGHGQR